MKDFFERIGGNFFIAAFVPTLGFVILGAVLFHPIIPPGLSDQINATFLGQPGLALLALTVVLGYTLASLNIFIYKVYEGYFLLERLPIVRRRIRRKVQQYQWELDRRAKQIEQLQTHNPANEDLELLRDEFYFRQAEYHQRFPPTLQSVLPTRFGNILRAAEYYSADRYGIDAVLLWPRLIHVIPPNYINQIDESNNGLAFLVNCSMLSLLMAGLCGLAAVYQWFLARWAGPTQPIMSQPGPLYFIPITEAAFVYHQRVGIYLVLGALMLGTAFIFYNATLPVARRYGNIIRSSFDLFRFKLLDQLNLPRPPDLRMEQDLWKKITEYYAVGGSDLFFNYEFRDSGQSATNNSL